ncbi:MAG TPA: ADP-ribosylglycohydrolase family protein [Polyangiaceae bacterium]|nr:ADP-ribosylglycohydrolase family protein [Polyangiaceae bacterium]
MGAVLGLALGDAFGAPFEGGPLERALWRLIGTTYDGRLRWTDDTQMSLDLAESLVASRAVNQDDIARRFARGYRWSRGYGPGAARILKLIRRGVDWRSANTRFFRDGSFGNGGAMRAPIVGLFSCSDLAAVQARARATAEVTHAHPLGQEGAVLVALATALLLRSDESRRVLDALAAIAEQDPFRERLAVAKSWLDNERPSPPQVRQHLGNGIAAPESCITAIYVALRFLDRPFPELLEFVAALGGDVDTIGAIAGALWGARNGDASLPASMLERLEDADRLRQMALALHRATLEGPSKFPSQS